MIDIDRCGSGRVLLLMAVVLKVEVAVHGRRPRMGDI